jgi:hypothetical protein
MKPLNKRMGHRRVGIGGSVSWPVRVPILTSAFRYVSGEDDVTMIPQLADILSQVWGEFGVLLGPSGTSSGHQPGTGVKHGVGHGKRGYLGT